MAVGDIYQAVIKQKLHGQTVLNVLHFRADTALNTAADLALQVATKIVTPMRVVQSAELSHEGVTAQKIWPLPPELAVLDLSELDPGAVAGDSLPTSVAVTVTKKTAFAGRRYRGRMFIGGVPVTSEANSTLAGAVLAAWIAAFAGLPASEWAATDWTPVLYHRDDHTYGIITNYEVRTNLHNQRRRQVGRGI